MIRLDQETTQKPLEEVEQLEMVMAHIPTKDLYGLQANVMQEVQSRAHADATNIEVGRGVTEMLQITCDQLTVEKEEEKEHIDRLEQGLTMTYNQIPNNAQQQSEVQRRRSTSLHRQSINTRQGDRGIKIKSQTHDSPGGEGEKETRSLQVKWMRWKNKSVQQQDCLTEQHNFGQRWRKTSRSSSGTRKKKE
jgi:hypothetical protein